MKFGKLQDLRQVDWSLPEDDPAGAAFLAGRGGGGLRIFFGAPAWGHPAWLGKIYPPGTKRADYLAHYARYFTCIELNTTHYRIPSVEQVGKWVAQVPAGFQFCPKIFQGLSHTRGGLADAELLHSWFAALAAFGGNLGPSFLQLPPHFDYGLKGELFAFLRSWPDEFPLALEFRHPSWFAEGGRILPALTQYLQSRGIGLVITDVAGRRDVLHTSISAEFALVRFVGNELHPTDFPRAQAWAERFARWEKLGLRRLFLFVHEPDDVSVPEMTEFFLRELSARGGWEFPEPPQMQAQLGLFGE